MGKKGDRASKGPIAFRLYSDGYSLEEIHRLVGVSVTSLSKWKKESKRPDRDQDEWDRARLQKASEVQRLHDLFDREMKFIEDSNAGESFGGAIDSLIKLGSLVKSFETIETARITARRAEESSPADIDKPAQFLGFLEWLALKLRETDPEGLKILARNFDSLVIQFKAEHAQTT